MSNKEFLRMTLDHVHQQNNKIIKSTGGATGLVEKCDDSSLIHWETCGPGIVKIVTEFEESKGKPLAKSVFSTKHHKDNYIFCQNFEFDIKTLSRGLPTNPFMSTKLHETNNIIVIPDFMFECIKSMEDPCETQLKNFVNDRLIF